MTTSNFTELYIEHSDSLFNIVDLSIDERVIKPDTNNDSVDLDLSELNKLIYDSRAIKEIDSEFTPRSDKESNNNSFSDIIAAKWSGNNRDDSGVLYEKFEKMKINKKKRSNFHKQKEAKPVEEKTHTPKLMITLTKSAFSKNQTMQVRIIHYILIYKKMFDHFLD